MLLRRGSVSISVHQRLKQKEPTRRWCQPIPLRSTVTTPPLLGENNPNRHRDRHRDRENMASGHEKLDVYRLAIGYVAWGLSIPKN